MSTTPGSKLSENDVWEMIDNVLHEAGIHCGIPPGAGEAHITTSFEPLAEILKDLNPPTQEETEWRRFTDNCGVEWTIHHHWKVSTQWKGWFGLVIVLKNETNGKFRKLFIPSLKHLQRWHYVGATLARRANYSLASAERQAQQRLFKALTQTQCEAYLVSDSVVETGRSGVMYLIRKNRPTIAVRPFTNERGEVCERLLCALCLHPTGYYTESWAGITPPSDEVLAHVLLIRSDEHFYWRQANQIQPDEANSGI